MSDIKVQDNFLYPPKLAEVQEAFSPWGYSGQPNPEPKYGNPITWSFGLIHNPKSLEGGEVVDPMFNYQCSHLIYHQTHPDIGINPIVSPVAHLLIPTFFGKFSYISILKIKANIVMKTEEIKLHSFHTDFPDHYDGLKTSIFYINSNDGYTEFEDGTKIESVANRLITFPQNMKHRGTTCTNQPFRMVINFNYI